MPFQFFPQPRLPQRFFRVDANRHAGGADADARVVGLPQIFQAAYGNRGGGGDNDAQPVAGKHAPAARLQKSGRIEFVHRLLRCKGHRRPLLDLACKDVGGRVVEPDGHIGVRLLEIVPDLVERILQRCRRRHRNRRFFFPSVIGLFFFPAAAAKERKRTEKGNRYGEFHCRVPSSFFCASVFNVLSPLLSSCAIV